MNTKPGVRRLTGMLLLAIVSAPACRSAEHVASSAEAAIVSGFESTVARARSEVDDLRLPSIESGVRLVQARRRAGPPRTEREALDQLRARRQEYLDSLR
jgi:hypothetical protein